MAIGASVREGRIIGEGHTTMRAVRSAALVMGVVAGLSLVAFAAYLLYVVRLWNQAMEA
jgi:hypothetical protein